MACMSVRVVIIPFPSQCQLVTAQLGYYSHVSYLLNHVDTKTILQRESQ